jgi:hypothetical protein
LSAAVQKTAPDVWRVLQAVWRATDGRPQAWRELDGLGLSENSIGVQRAVTDTNGPKH